MALWDITNKPSKFRLHVDLDHEYATMRSNRSKGCIPVEVLRLQGVKAIDLWTDGSIYPLDPQTGAPPPFRNITQVVHFLGDGFKGLLGYCQRLYSLYLQELTNQNHIQQNLKMLLASCRAEKEECASTFMVEKEQLLAQIKDLRKQVAEQKTKLDEGMENRDRAIDNCLCL